jgi:hypothetical protein
MKRLIKVVAFTFLFGSFSARAELIRIASGSGGETFVSPADITFLDDGFQIKTISNWLVPVSYSRGIAVKSIEFVYEVKCSTNVERMMRAVAFNGEMGTGRVLETSPATQKWEAISKGSGNDVMRDAICKK